MNGKENSISNFMIKIISSSLLSINKNVINEDCTIFHPNTVD